MNKIETVLLGLILFSIYGQIICFINLYKKIIFTEKYLDEFIARYITQHNI